MYDLVFNSVEFKVEKFVSEQTCPKTIAGRASESSLLTETKTGIVTFNHRRRFLQIKGNFEQKYFVAN